jgi:long-chain fatty acid transport protein
VPKSCGIGIRALARTLVLIAIGNSLALGQGIAFRGVSPVNSSMGGAATGCALDSAGALHWNPGSISALPSSDISLAMELILPTEELSSQLGPLSGSTMGEPGVTPVPSMAFVHKSADSPWTWGVGVFGVGGSSVSYPASFTNPILTPQPAQGGAGLGQLTANAEIVQIVPTLSYQLTDHLSVGIAPTITMAKLYASPLFLGPVNLPGGSWSSGVGTRYVWGGGVQVGAYYKTDNCWNFGAALSSPNWTEPFRFQSVDEHGLPRETVKYSLDYPLVASIGTSYTGFENWIFACDVRYFDYADTTGFRDLGFSPTGALQGLGWNSVMSVAVGAQRRIGECWTVRVGYCFNENPISGDSASFNVASPLIGQHAVSTGFSRVFSDNWIASVAYTHVFQNSVTGPLYTPASPLPVPGYTVTSTASADALSAGITKRF